MVSSNKTIHVHLGVDNVFESALENISTLGLMETSPRMTKLIPNEIYKKHFRDAIDRGDGLVTNGNLAALGFEASNLVISRPRLLYTGVPMNTSEGAEKALYKLDSIQAAFAEFRLVFHLFITDHLTYLFGPQKRNVSLTPDRSVSWGPLIQGVTARLQRNNELDVQDAERADIFYQGLLVHLLGHTEVDAEALCLKFSIETQQKVRLDAPESRALSAGWSIDHLDDCYDRDVMKFFEHH